MVTDEKIFNAALLRYRLGSVLVWLGVLVWVPFIVLRIAGEQPPMIWYLPLHLVGVMSGSRLRAYARREMGLPPPKKSRLRMFGHGLIFAGILVWAPYFYLNTVQQAVDVMNYLPYHLAGVLGGTIILAIDYWVSGRNGAGN
jgi:polyferredoxin